MSVIIMSNIVCIVLLFSGMACLYNYGNDPRTAYIPHARLRVPTAGTDAYHLSSLLPAVDFASFSSPGGPCQVLQPIPPVDYTSYTCPGGARHGWALTSSYVSAAGVSSLYSDYQFRPYPGLTGGGSLIDWGGGRASSAQCRPRHAPPEFFVINLIEYGVSFCILKYNTLSLYLWKRCAGGTR